MDTNKSFRSRVMEYAWQIFRSTSRKWSACLSQAWKLYKLATAMKDRVVMFLYGKKDGSVRVAYGTLHGAPFTRGGSIKTFRYFDTVKGAYRSFSVENYLTAAL